MPLTQKSLVVGLVSAALLGGLGVSAQTTTAEATDPQTSPSRSFVTDLAKDGENAVNEESIQKMRDDDRMGWGQIANFLGLNLGAVVSAANRAEPATLNAANKSEKSGQYGQSANASSRSSAGAGNNGGNGGGKGGGNGGGGGRGK